MHSVMTTGWEDGIAELTERLVHELSAGKKVLWIVSGGSNIPASVQVMDSISFDLSKNLTVLLGDERYGKHGHPDSNCQQLHESGFNQEQAYIRHILEHKGSLEDTTGYYRRVAEEEFASADVVIAQLGIGEDGHIAGILPDSSASREQNALVASFEGQDFPRMTLTFPALKKIDAAYVFAFGSGKESALQQLFHQDLPLTEQPAQILKALPEAYVYNDQIEE